MEAVSTYSATLEHLHYHLKERMDYDYVLTLGRKCIYIARNTEDDEDVLVLKDIVFFSEPTIHNEL